MSLPYFPMYPSDFEAKTSHLTIAEDGAYNRLLRICWMTQGCTMPADEAWIMRRARAVTDDDKAAVLAVLAEFFTIENGRYSNARLCREWLAANEAHERRKNAGAKGGKAKSLQAKEKTPSKAKAMPKQPEPEPEPYIEKEDTKVSSKKKGSRLSPEWVLPADWGDWAASQGMTAQQVLDQADRFRDYWIGKSGAGASKADWRATWRNWIRNAIERLGKQNGKPVETGSEIARLAADRFAARRMGSGQSSGSLVPLLPAGYASGQANGGD